MSQLQVPRAPQGNPLLDAALSYAARGWAVLPLHTPVGGVRPCSCGRADCPSVGKHPRTEHGLADVTTDQEVITAWWRRWPDANVGIVTGGVSGIDVVDVDPRHGGDKTLADLQKVHGQLADTVEAATGGGGVHYYFGHSPGLRCRTGFSPGLDFKTDGGYVVAPPSLHESGEAYSWNRHPDEIELASLPAWSHDLVRVREGDQGTVRHVSHNGAIPEGKRNDYLCSVAGTLRRRDMSADAIEAALLTENSARCSPPLDEHEVLKIARSIRRYEPSVAAVDGGDWFELTDTGNAKRFVRRFGGEYRFCHPWKKGLVWDGRRWKLDDSGFGLRMTREIVAEVEEQAAHEPDEDVREALQKWAKRSGMVERRRAMAALAAVEPGIPVLHTDLDQHPLLLNVANGTLDLETLRLRDHKRADLLTQQILIPYEPKATCPAFERFLERIVPDGELRAFLQRAVGYCLSGLVGEQVLFFVYGIGANGKSTFLGVIQVMLGPDYELEAAPDLLLSKHGTPHPTELADLFGKRFVVCQESGEGRALDETRVKRLTGGDPITARRMREDFWTFSPTHKLWLSSNYQPQIRGTDEGIWRRVLLVPFEQFIPKGERDRKLPEKLRAELPGILTWAVRGWTDYRRGAGLRPPEAVRLATQQYREEQDVLGRFITERLRAAPGERLPAQALHAAYGAWCTANGETTVSSALLGSLLRHRGFRKEKRGRVVYLDLRLRGGA